MPALIHNETLAIQPPADLLQQRPELAHAGQALALKYAGHQVVTDAELQGFGAALWHTLHLDDLLEQALQRAGAHVLPLVVRSADPAMQQLPWEILHHPRHGFLGTSPHCTLSRCIPGTAVHAPAPECGPLRVLLFTALPDDVHPETGRLNVEEEQAQVQEALLPWIAKGLVILDMPDDGRLSTLRDRLREFQPHLLFLSGHGNFVHQPHTQEAPYGTFLFEDDFGHGQAVRDAAIAEAFVGSNVQCVVLVACESGKAASDALNNGLARQLSRQGLPHVIGMRESLLDVAGIQFARQFCDAIAGRERVDVALQWARHAITQPLKGQTWLDGEAGGLAELSLGQWCLPMLLAPDPGRPLIDWNFTPRPPEQRLSNQSLNTVTLPARFVGRRSELRALKSRWRGGALRQLLIVGPGGQGKTALAGKLAQDFQRDGGEVLAWSARAANAWETLLFEAELQLTPANTERYDRMRAKYTDETQRASVLLRLLLNQSQNRLALLFDNLESLQDPATRELTDLRLTAWIRAAQQLEPQGLTLLLTSRWQVPGWPEADLWRLEHVNYGDFLHIARRQNLPNAFLQDRERLRTVYRTLHGNIRGLEFFAAAIQGLAPAEEAAFLARLAQAATELQTDMAIARVVGHLDDQARELLGRLPAYHTPVPIEGIIKLGLDLPRPEALLERLLAVSLVEQHAAPEWQTREYQCSPLVADWLRGQGAPAPALELRRAAADYQLYLFRRERRTLSQALNAHQALRAADRLEDAHHLALDYIVGPLNRQGLYRTLLTEWLPEICESADQRTRADALNQTGLQHHYVGEYDTAIDYLQRSLTIQQQIGDKQGEGVPLNNIGQIYHARGDYATALDYFQRSLTIQQQIGDKQGEGTTLNNIGQIYKARSDYDAALDYLQRSLTIWQEIGDKPGEGAALNNIGQIYYARGDYATALDYLHRSLTIRQQTGDKRGEGVNLNNISNIFHARGDYESALEYSKRDLAICQEIGDKPGEGTTLNNISQIYKARGDSATALDYLQRSLTIRQQIGDKQGEGVTLDNIGQIYCVHGDFSTALTYFQQALTIRQQIGDKQGEGVTLNNISQIYKARGDSATALDYLQRSLTIQQQIGDKQGEGTTLNNISQIYAARGDSATALDYLQRSLTISQQISDKQGEGTTLNNIAAIYQARGDSATALDYIQRSLTIQQQIGDVAGLCATLFNMGHLHLQNEEPTEAMRAWLTAYQLARQMQLANVLNALEQLAGQLGLAGGLKAWERLAQGENYTERP